MELRIVLSVISLIFSGILQTITPALIRQETQPVVTTSSPHHIRTKRCSCASFLDKECVYFCHLDIIWINTPERTVSYGLGSAPRKKRSLANPFVLLHTQQSRRCECLDNEDSTCLRFCQPDNPPRLRAANIPTQRNNCAAWQYLYNLTANKRDIKRTQNKSQRSRMPSPLRSMQRAAHWHWALVWGSKNAAL